MSNQESTEESAATTPRRRRAASRPAGPPAAAKAAAEAVPAAPAEAAGESKPATTRRRSATKAAAAADAPAESQAETKPATRRRRSQKPAAAEETPEIGAEAAQPEQETAKKTNKAKKSTGKKTAGAKAESDSVATEAGVEDAAAEQPAGSRRRSTKKQPDEAVQATTDDSISAALIAAESSAKRRQRTLSDPFAVTEAGKQEELQQLAEQIAGSDAEEGAEKKSKKAKSGTKKKSGKKDDKDGKESKDGKDAKEGKEKKAKKAKKQASDADTKDDAADDVSDADKGDDSAEDEASEGRTRRRRRRGGRRRRRGRGGDEDNSAADSDDSAGEEDETSKDDDAETTGTSRRRRRRRRGGDDSGDDSVTSIEGSTRMEAKRQRRKESRAAGRRRAPILSESEFLARRESVKREMVIRQSDDYTQIAVLEDDILVEHYVDRASATSLIGNVYLGRIQNVLPSMEAAFIDIGRGRNAVLYAGEVDWDSFGVTAENRKVENVLKSGQPILVQVTKDPVGQKGARLSNHISLPGRYVVYSPGGHLSGVSRKLPDTERSRLKQILGELISDEESVIVRTAAEGVSSEELVRDVNRLKTQWEIIEKKVKQGKAPTVLYAEPDATLRIVRDLFTEDFGKLKVQGNGGQEDAFEAVSAYVAHVAPHLSDRLERFEVGEDGTDIFAKHRIDEQIAKALDRKVFLPSGGSLVIDRTEAMTVIDVNTGRFTGSAGNLEATVTSNNLEAAEEIVRQLRLRDLGGIVVIDFIDMVLPSNRELLLRRLVECLARDRTRHQVAEVTSLGLVQLTRKRIGTGLAEAFTESCSHCAGAGYVKSVDPVDAQEQPDGGSRKGRRRN